MAQAPASPPQGEADPSMDDILASIRRILSDEEKAAKSQRPEEGVLMLEPSMMIEDTTTSEAGAPTPQPPHGEAHPHHAAPQPDPGVATHLMIAGDETPPRPAALMTPAVEPGHHTETPPDPGATLVAPEAAAMAQSSVGALMRTLVAERTAVVHRGGPSIEDVVREEIRPLLKQWLDAHLPPLVERLVRAEIERVVGRIGT